MKMNGITHQQRIIFFALTFLLCARFFSMITMPLNDKTEARYGEIARLMVVEDNWVTLLQAPHDPFWAKPPLSTWASALSMKILGVHAWSARLPALFFSVGVLLLTGYLAKKKYPLTSLNGYSMLILAGSPYFLINAGVVMTDPALIFSSTLCMTMAWLAMNSSNIWYGYLFFVGIGLGLLAKGPLIGILTILPLFLWSLQQRNYRQLWHQLPWIKGGILSLLIAGPWYICAEIRTPGFLNYFIIGEHISRFLQTGWTGDKYGFAHAAPYGMIWIYLLGGVLPWLVWFFMGWVAQLKSKTKNPQPMDISWMSYLLFFALTPLVFFTFSRNIIYTYTFTSLPALTLLFTEALHRKFLKLTFYQCVFITMIWSGIFCGIAFLFLLKPEWVAKSQDRVVQTWQQQHSETPLIYWASQPDYSAQFYAAGQVIAVREVTALNRLLQTNKEHYIAVRGAQLQEIPLSIRTQWIPLKTIVVQNRPVFLFRT